MKYLIAFILMFFASLLFTAIPGKATAESNNFQQYTVFSNYSGLASGTTTNSAAYNVNGYRKMIVAFGGASTASNLPAEIKGTVKVQCGSTSAGPFVTMKDFLGNTASTTSNGIYTFNDICQYVRVTWTKTRHRINAWLRVQE